MLLLREEQILEKVQEATKLVGEELGERKGSYAAGGKNQIFLMA